MLDFDAVVSRSFCAPFDMPIIRQSGPNRKGGRRASSARLPGDELIFVQARSELFHL